jgi:hypothetical protein
MLRRLLLLSIPAAMLMAADKPDFSGHWVADLAKSDFGMMPPPSKLERDIDHKDPDISLKMLQVGERGEMKTESKFTTDGKEAKIQMRGREAKVKAKWDGSKLKMSYKTEFNGMEISQEEVWTMSDDGKSFTIDNAIKAPQGEFTTKSVFTKGS